MTSLPGDKDCTKISNGGETLYQCDGTLYRSTYYQDEKVYEVVSDAAGETSEPVSVIGMGLSDPMIRGDLVRDMQERLVYAGYDVGGVDGVFGSGTETAVMWLQYDNGLDATGVIDVATAKLLGYEAPAVPGAPAVPASDPGAASQQLAPEPEPEPASDRAADTASDPTATDPTPDTGEARPAPSE